MNNPRHVFRVFPALAVLLATGFAAVQADDLAMVTIADEAHATAAKDICGHAAGRWHNQFLVVLNENQKNALAVQRVDFQIVAENIDPAQWYVIRDMVRKPEAVRGVPGRVERLLELGGGLRLLQGTPGAAASLSETGRFTAVPLAEVSVSFVYRPAAAPSAPLDSYPEDSLATRVKQDSVYAYVTHLEGFETRYTYSSKNDDAREWIISKYQQFGYTDVTNQGFWGEIYHRNVKCVKLGTVEPNKIIVIGGHFDSINFDSDPMDFAPGADDNASGTVTAMEVARILADIPLRKTVVFYAFDAEEIGLLGSDAAAAEFENAGADIEVMYNFDMVGFTAGGDWELNIASNENYAYRDLTAATMERLTSISPHITNPGFSSDHYSFMQHGFEVVDHIETDFNNLGWHTNLDISSRMNFVYLTDVIKTAAVSLAIVANSPSPAVVSELLDYGDGARLWVSWDECLSDCDYWVRWGSVSGEATDSVLVPAGECECTVTGLQDGVRYYVSAIAVTPDGYPALYGAESSEIPYVYPRSPKGMQAEAVAGQLRLEVAWDANQEMDFAYYNLYRRVGPYGSFKRIATGLGETSFTDEDVVALVSYGYQVTAVDEDGYESEPSELVDLYPATFNGGMAVIDSYLKEVMKDPTQDHYEAWLDTVFNTAGYSLIVADSANDVVRLTNVGPYSVLYWMDDDTGTKTVAASQAMLETYSQQNTGMCISGWHTIFNWTPKTIAPGHLLYREFGVSAYDYNQSYFDFVGAHGQNGWPSTEMDRRRGMIGEWRDIAYFTLLPGAVPILTYDSKNDMPDTEGQIVGVAYESAHGKRLLFGFPFYQMTAPSATALLAKAVEYFGGSSVYEPGDLDHSGTIEIGDVMVLVDHLFVSETPLAYPDEAEMNGVPGITIGDIGFLINYLFLGGPAPVL